MSAPSTATPVITHFGHEVVPERSSRTYVAYLKDGATGLPLSVSLVSAITLTLYDQVTASIVNGRNNTNVLNTNGGTLASVIEGGSTKTKFTFQFTNLDNASLSATRLQRRIATFKWTFFAGFENHQVTWDVEDLTQVP